MKPIILLISTKNGTPRQTTAVQANKAFHGTDYKFLASLG